jgi:hypothetical protein
MAVRHAAFFSEAGNDYAEDQGYYEEANYLYV